MEANDKLFGGSNEQRQSAGKFLRSYRIAGVSSSDDLEVYAAADVDHLERRAEALDVPLLQLLGHGARV